MGNENNIDEIKEEVIKVLKTCYDPEIPVNIYELGLIYDIKVLEDKDVNILMTLTSPMCPVADILPLQVESKVRSLPTIDNAIVDLTFDPPWTPDKMSEAAKLELGFL
ncbi:metal-sulfur cluster assembly factor [Bacteroidota bacterium]